jgi:hypothetical protein
MVRAFFEGLLLFLTPFVLFGLWLVLRHGRGGEAKDAMSGALGWLTIVGLGLTIAAILWQAFTVEPHRGAYTPAELRDGKLVPGEVK